MINFNDLPLVIRVKVLSTIVEENYECLSTWKDSLPLMAVCREWRALAKPMVYGTTIVENLTEDNYDALEYDNGNDNTINGNNNDAAIATRPPFVSNIPLIAAANGTHLVKNLLIYLNEHTLTLDTLKELTTVFNFTQCDWTNVRSMDLEMRLNYEGRNADENKNEYLYNKSPKLEHGMSLFAQALTRSMPEVTRIKARAHTYDGVAKILFNRLCKAYTHQLTHLSCYPEIKLPTVSELKGMQYLNIATNSSVKKPLPQICPSSLRKMELKQLSANFSWKFFENKYQPNAISFNNMKSLTMSYMPLLDDIEAETARMMFEKHYENKKHNVSFPKLEELTISGGVVDQDMITSAVLPSHLKSLTVWESLENLRLCLHLNTQSIGKLRAIINLDYYDSESEFYRVTNQLFGAASSCNEVTVELRNVPFELSPKHMEWSKVTELIVGNDIEYATLTELLCSVPNLVELNVANLSSNFIPEDMLTADGVVRVDDSAMPLNTSIRKAWFMNIAEDSSEDMTPLCVQSLVLRLPSLSSVKTFYLEDEALEEFTELHQHVYPHLNVLEVV
ncbi:hypothetical protein GGI07_004875 [Coemansia sp. Benny D115]|nr:hypothetical protein GGI07_004875 [Coemansia sp. Benny D115]